MSRPELDLISGTHVTLHYVIWAVCELVMIWSNGNFVHPIFANLIGDLPASCSMAVLDDTDPTSFLATQV